MQVEELFRTLQIQDEHTRMESEVRILVDKPSIGPRASVKVKNATFGFDWESGKFLLRPDVSLVPKTDKEKLWDMAHDLLMFIATKPVKKESYEVGCARRIFKRLGVDYMKYQSVMGHK